MNWVQEVKASEGVHGGAHGGGLLFDEDRRQLVVKFCTGNLQ